MSEPRRVLLVGATGLVGTRVMEACVGRDDVRLVALTRREARMPPGARMEMLVAEPAGWARAVATVAPDSVICALGTTWRKAGRDEAAFRAVDEELVLRVAKAAKEAGTANFVLVSAVGADAHSRAFYWRVKGEVETALRKLGLHRLDILRPGLLRGPRGNDRRPRERLAVLLSPLADLFLQGARRRLRSIDARVVARAALRGAQEKARGTFVHDNDGIHRLERRLDGFS
jgi:uncharacterized protein YbjT (DUF2867 family)